MAKLILMCGCPGSGKSTWIQKHIEEDSQLWVSRDKIRFSLVKETEPYFSKETQVFNTFINEIIDGLKNDFDVYADATHLTPESRAKLLRRIPAHLYDELEIIYIKVDISIALQQNELRNGTRAYVDPHAVRRMYYSFMMPSLDEGFDAIYVIETNKPIQKITTED